MPIVPFSIANLVLGAGLLAWVFALTGHVGRHRWLTILLLVITYAMPLLAKPLGATIVGSGRRAPFWVLYITGGLAGYLAAMALAAAWWTGGVSPNRWLQTVLWNAVDVIPALDIPSVFGWSPPFDQPGGLQSAILVVVRLVSILFVVGLVKLVYDTWKPPQFGGSKRDANRSNT